MLILADQNIPEAAAAFAGLGEVRLYRGRELSRAQLRDADVLLVRSVTPVDERLLAGTPVKFVGSATIGVDHVDRDYLERAGVGFAYAPGSSARAVAEYVICALLALLTEQYRALADHTVGIVGCGHIGSELAALLRTLGVQCLLNDPPRQAAGDVAEPWTALPELLRRSDIVSLHVPLTDQGRWPTRRMVNEGFLDRLKPGAVLLNTARGDVVDGPALRSRLRSAGLEAVLDVWPAEPAVDAGLLAAAALATPHVAGYSLEGKLNGVGQVYRQACAFFGVEPRWRPSPPAAETVCTVAEELSGQAALARLLAQVYDIRADDRRLRSLADAGQTQRTAGFDALRRDYIVRREFSAYGCRYHGDDETAELIRALGFQLLPMKNRE